jgi:hypothetical protein
VSQHSAAAVAALGSSVSTQALVVKTRRTRHGPLKGGKRMWVQLAIAELYGGSLPRGPVNFLDLTRRVQKILSRDSEYRKAGYSEIDRATVKRALQDLRGERRAPPKPWVRPEPPGAVITGPLARRPARRPLTAEEVKAAADRAERKATGRR